VGGGGEGRGEEGEIGCVPIVADAEGMLRGGGGPDGAEEIDHFQPPPPLGSPSYKKFQKLMGATDENALYLFAGNTHDQICTLALAMEKAKSTVSLVYTKEIPAVDNPPGEEIDEILVALKKVREGVKINFQGAGSICDFDARGDQLN